MPGKTVYIHYGDNRYRTPDPIKNRVNPRCIHPFYATKPRGGLWASRKYGEQTWRDWCTAEGFRLDDFNTSFEFTLADDSRVLELNNIDQLDYLPKLCAFDIKNWRMEECYLDFEELKKSYDAVEVTNIGDLYFPLYGWDCNSILIMNPDIVELQCEEAY